jgi:integrase
MGRVAPALLCGPAVPRHQIGRRAMLSTLVLGGLRIGELTALRWRDLGLASGTLWVGESKSDAGVRQVDMLPALRDELSAHKARVSSATADEYVFAASTGRRHGASNLRRRVLAPAVNRANQHLAKLDLAPLPSGLTPHSLRRTFASLLIARGEDPAYVTRQMGHTTPHLTLSLYAKAMKRSDGERERLRALLDGSHLEPVPSREFSAASQRDVRA